SNGRIFVCFPALLSAVVGLCLLINTGQSAVLTSASPLQNAILTTQTSDNTTGQLRTLHSNRSCREEHKYFCANGAICRYPQDSEKPFCICTSLYQGLRCMVPVIPHSSRTLPESQQVIAISIGIIIFLILLAIGIYICVSKKCVKSSPLIKSAPSETSV
uniref:Epigen-like n=1 Tax=Gouania willdenowi TaxID=441366 RepID=A0A8C5H1B0_GOUWI